MPNVWENNRITIPKLARAYSEDFSFGGRPVKAARLFGPEPQGQRLANPAVVPPDSAHCCAWNSSGTMLAVGHYTSPYLTVYYYNGETFTKLANPATLPTGTVYGVAWHPNNVHLAVGMNNAPYVHVYTVYPPADGSTDITKQAADPATTPTGRVYDLEFSPDGRILSVGHVNSPFLSNYQYAANVGVGSPTLTKLSNPASLPSGSVGGVSWHPSGRYLSIGTSLTPYVATYQFNGVTFTKLANPASLPDTVDGPHVPKWSPCGRYLAVSMLSSPYGCFYYVEPATMEHTKYNLAGQSEPMTGLDWSPDGRFIASSGVSQLAGSPGLVVHRFFGTGASGLTYITPAPTTNDVGNGVSFSPDGKLLAFVCLSPPYIAIYKAASDGRQVGMLVDLEVQSNIP